MVKLSSDYTKHVTLNMSAPHNIFLLEIPGIVLFIRMNIDKSENMWIYEYSSNLAILSMAKVVRL